MIDIQKRRKELNMTQKDLADKVGVTTQAISQWEHVQTEPDRGNIPRLAEALNLSVAELLGQAKQPSWILKDKLFSEEHMFTRLKTTAEAENLQLTKQALYYAREKHSGQIRKKSIFSDIRVPYIAHPLLMACQALAAGIHDDEVLAAILLHDVCEDCDVLPEELPFPQNVRDAVNLLTKKDGQSIDEYYAGIRGSEIASIIKLFDRCNNVSMMASAFSDDKLTEYILETEEYVLPLAAFTKRGEFSNATFLLKYQICSTVETIKAMMRR